MGCEEEEKCLNCYCTGIRALNPHTHGAVGWTSMPDYQFTGILM